jgi:hypothetical protein
VRGRKIEERERVRLDNVSFSYVIFHVNFNRNVKSQRHPEIPSSLPIKRERERDRERERECVCGR